MQEHAQVIYKRINAIKAKLTETDKVQEILKDLEAQGIHTTEDTIQRDIREIYRGAYPDPWLDNFLNIVYPGMFKQCIEGLNKCLSDLDKYTGAETNSSKNTITAINSKAKIQLELINLMHKGPSVKMMRALKVKADKLAEALDQERTITKKLP